MKMNERFGRRLVSLIIAALLICTAGPVFAEGEKTAPSLDDTVTAAVNTDGQVRFIETEPESDVKNIRFNFMDTKAQAYNWRFPYSDWYVIVPHFIVIAISAFSVPNMIAFFVMVTLLSVLAAMTFRRGSMFRRIKQKNSAA